MPKNRVFGYADFLRRWKSREEATGHEVHINRGSHGNINLTGGTECCSSYLLTQWHPKFLDSLEPGVKDLVERLIEAWDCVTYSSCEGHRRTKDEPMRIRNVRIGTRSLHEHAKLMERAGKLCKRVNRSTELTCVLLRSSESELELEEGFSAPSIDLVFSSTENDEDAYWRGIESVYCEAVAVLREGAGYPRTGIANEAAVRNKRSCNATGRVSTATE